MDQQVAMDLNGIMMAHQLEDQQNRLKSGINEIAAEVIRVTSVMGTAVSHLAEKAHESDQRVIEELKAWTAELEKRVCQALRDLAAQVPTAATVKKLVEIHLREMNERLNQSFASSEHTLKQHLENEIRQIREQMFELSKQRGNGNTGALEKDIQDLKLKVSTEKFDNQQSSAA